MRSVDWLLGWMLLVAVAAAYDVNYDLGEGGSLKFYKKPKCLKEFSGCSHELQCCKGQLCLKKEGRNRGRCVDIKRLESCTSSADCSECCTCKVQQVHARIKPLSFCVGRLQQKLVCQRRNGKGERLSCRNEGQSVRGIRPERIVDGEGRTRSGERGRGGRERSENLVINDEIVKEYRNELANSIEKLEKVVNMKNKNDKDTRYERHNSGIRHPTGLDVVGGGPNRESSRRMGKGWVTGKGLWGNRREGWVRRQNGRGGYYKIPTHITMPHRPVMLSYTQGLLAVKEAYDSLYGPASFHIKGRGKKNNNNNNNDDDVDDGDDGGDQNDFIIGKSGKRSVNEFLMSEVGNGNNSADENGLNVNVVKNDDGEGGRGVNEDYNDNGGNRVDDGYGGTKENEDDDGGYGVGDRFYGGSMKESSYNRHEVNDDADDADDYGNRNDNNYDNDSIYLSDGNDDDSGGYNRVKVGSSGGGMGGAGEGGGSDYREGLKKKFLQKELSHKKRKRLMNFSY